MALAILMIYIIGLFVAPIVLKRLNDKHHWMTKSDLRHDCGSILCILVILAIIGWPVSLAIGVFGNVFRLLFISLFPDV